MSAQPPGRRLLFGTTSYVLPADLIPNVRLLAPLVEDIELILFEGEVDNLPSPPEVGILRDLGREGGCGFTVHLPLDVGLGEEEDSLRRRGQDVCLRVMELTSPLEPRAYVVHPELPLEYHPAFGEAVRPLRSLPGDILQGWRRALGESLQRLGEQAAGTPVAVENLNFPYEWVWGLVEDLGLGVVLDVGHLLLGGGDVAGFLERYGGRLQVVHLHGVEGAPAEGSDGGGAADHRTVALFPPGELEALLDGFRLSGAAVGRTPLPVTCEVFGAGSVVSSLQALSEVVETASLQSSAGPQRRGPDLARSLSRAARVIRKESQKSMG